MGGLTGTGSGSPIQARATAPIFLIFLILIIIIAVLGLIFFLTLQFSKYKKSEKYISRQQERPTKKKDVKELGKNLQLGVPETNILWKVCLAAEFPNILYNLKTIDEVDTLFRKAYPLLKEKGEFTDESLNDFYTVLYKLELMIAQRKSINSTRQISLGMTVSYLSDTGEQYPLTVVENTRETLTLEIPDFINSSKERPKPLVRSRFIYKMPDGLTYNFVSRIIRFDSVLREGKNHHTMVISHSEQLDSQAQRHFKRGFTEHQCTFCALRFSKDNETGKVMYIYSDKIYKGKLSNISAGGCCIHTNLPVKEKQNISVSVAALDLWKLPGVIRNTRRLPGGKFALHIQFTNISLATKNKINGIIYNYDL